MHGHPAPRRAAGFTLPELVTVMVLVGLLAAIAVPRFAGRSVFDERGFFDQTLAAARYAHKRAISTGCDVQLAVDGSGFALSRRAGCSSGAFTVPLSHPSRPGNFAAAAPAGLAVAPATAIYFDRIGRPRNPAGDALIGGVTSIQIGSRRLDIAPETGFAEGG